MNSMYKHFLTFLTFFALSNAFSQEETTQTTSFTLEEAVLFAQENSYKAINSNRNLEDAKKQRWETIAAGLPQVNGAISYQNQLKQPTTLLPAEITGGEAGTFVPVIFGQPQSVSATATLTQQIFNGSYIVGVQASKVLLTYSNNNNEKTLLDIRKAVTEAYGNVLLSEESTSILEKNLVNLEKNLNEATKVFENGLGEEESVEQLQITLSSVDNQLKNAVRLKEITLQMLNLIMGIDISAPTQLEENLDDLTAKQVDFDLLGTELNIENNIDFKMVSNLNDQRFLEWKLARSYALPTLNAFVNYGTSGYASEFDFLSSDQQWFDSSILGFELNIPIFSSGKRSAGTARAKIALEQAKTQLTEAEQQIRLQLKSAKSNYTLAIEQYETAKQNLTLAERIESKNQAKYAEGLASSFDLRQAQTQLYDAQQNYLQSMVEVINKKTNLETILNIN